VSNKSKMKLRKSKLFLNSKSREKGRKALVVLPPRWASVLSSRVVVAKPKTSHHTNPHHNNNHLNKHHSNTLRKNIKNL